MLDEIPTLDVITAIESPEFEDYVAELLYSQGWSIVHRALDGYSLPEILSQRQGLRTLLVYTSGIPGFASEILLHQESLGFIAISLDAAEERLNPHLIMSAIRSRVRTPEKVVATRPALTRSLEHAIQKRRVITLTGTGGSPGRSMMAKALAEELSLSLPTMLVDADFRNRSLTRSFHRNDRPAFEFATLDPSLRPTNLPEVGERDISIVDIGTVPPLTDLMNDRRWQAAFLTSTLEQSSHLLYICKSTETSIAELQEFISAPPALLRDTPLTFLCISQASTRSDRQALARFDSLLAGSRREVVQQRLLLNSSTIPLLTTPTRSKKEIARIALSLI